jgi:predicted AlkP superfamily pyrophosphatase or phosphodiesterase
LCRCCFDFSLIGKELNEIDELLRKLVTFYEQRNAEIVILSEYGIAPVSNPLHLNRIFREHGLLAIREERGLELLDPGASKAFVVADHQIAHVYINDPSCTDEVTSLLKQVKGVELILDRKQQSEYKIDHERAGDLVLMSDEDSWFTYYFWENDDVAPDYARTIDIHRKPGYDPCELFIDPTIRFPKWRIALFLLKKKLGLRGLLDVIPLDASLVKGSHGRDRVSLKEQPVLLGTDYPVTSAEDVHEAILSSARNLPA